MTSLTELTAERTDFKKGKTDPKVSKSTEILNNSKKVTPLITELTKSITKYHALLTSISAQGLVIASQLEKIAELNPGEMESGIKALATAQKHIEEGHTRVAEAFMSGLVVAVGAAVQDDQKAALNFERDFKRKRVSSLERIQKTEARCKKAQKKVKRNPDGLQIELKSLEEAISAHDQYLGDSLREITALHRKRYSALVKGWLDVMEQEIELFSISYVELGETQGQLRPLLDGTSGGDQQAMEQLISESKPEKTIEKLRSARQEGSYDLNHQISVYDSAPLKKMENGGGFGSPDEEIAEEDDAPDLPPRAGGGNFGTQTLPLPSRMPKSASPSFSADDSASRVTRVRAKFPYTQQRPDELSFQQGDIFVLIEETTENWWKGDLNGQIGLFPASYVEKMMSVGGS